MDESEEEEDNDSDDYFWHYLRDYHCDHYCNDHHHDCHEDDNANNHCSRASLLSVQIHYCCNCKAGGSDLLLFESGCISTC